MNMKPIPVVTLSPRHTIDRMVTRHLKNHTDTMMVSYFSAMTAGTLPPMKRMIDSGGYASMKPGTTIETDGRWHLLKHKNGILHPLEVLEFQLRHADHGFTLDFIPLAELPYPERKKRFQATLQNATETLKHHRSQQQTGNTKPMVLHASLQCWDTHTAKEASSHYRTLGFTHIGIGGMVPHAQNPCYVRQIIQAVRAAHPSAKLHVFGLGNPSNTQMLLRNHVDTADSSSYVQQAMRGIDWRNNKQINNATHHQTAQIALSNFRHLQELCDTTHPMAQ